jgi:hypothetical protein
MFKINQDDLIEAVKALQASHKEQKQVLEKIIRPFLTDNLNHNRQLNFAKLENL